jgi:hypothetical protein
LALVPDEVELLTVSGPSGLLNRIDEILKKRILKSHALSGGWAGAEKAVEKCTHFDLGS